VLVTLRIWSILSWFHKSHHRNHRNNSQALLKQAGLIRILGKDMEQIQAQVETIHTLLQKHDQEISNQAQRIETADQRLVNLEGLVRPSINPPTVPRQSPPENHPTPLASKIIPHPANRPQGFDVEHFSQQEKRILSIFFQHPEMALSYVDIAHFLNKSPHTVKNQMHQITTKTDLFERAIDPQNRNRFRLKEGLKIEKYLQVGDPSRSGSTMGGPIWSEDR
jgi:DNA-binding CsgD family transcriptional regulator